MNLLPGPGWHTYRWLVIANRELDALSASRTRAGIITAQTCQAEIHLQSEEGGQWPIID